MDNFDFSPGSGAVGAAKNIGGVLYPQVITTEIDGTDTGIAAKLGSLTETAPSTDTASSGLNGRLQRVAQRLTSLIALIPALGQSTKSASLPVTIASDDDLQGKVGSLTETAPATDTASSGLNGRLQRVAQRLTSLIALLPTALGAGGGIKVDGSGTPLPVSGTVTANIGTSGSLALETGGNLATIASVVSSSKMAVKAASSDFADGSIATIGTKADAKNSASDTTAITLMSVLKQISFSIQAAAASLAGTLTVATHAVTQSGTWNIGTVTTLPAIPAGTNNIGFITLTPSTTGGWSPSSQTALSNTKTSVKSSAGNVGGYMFYNPNSSAVYIQVFDVASGSVTVGSTTPTYVIPIPATAGANVEFTNGINHATAIVVAATTTATGSTAPSTALTGFFLFK